jgi:mRNA interferase MazF
MSLPEPKRGDVWLANLDKLRPVVILTRDPLGRYLHSIVVGPVTSTIRGLSTEVEVGPDDGVRIQSVINLDNLQLVERSCLQRKVGHVRQSTKEQICAAVAIAIDCRG